MTKLQQMLTSLIAAIPAAFLGYVLVMAMFSHSESLTTIAYVMIGLTLLCALAAAGIPAFVMLGNKPKPVVAKSASKTPETGDDIDAVDDDVELSGDSSSSVIVDEELGESAEFDLSDSSQTLASGSEDDLSTEALEEFELDDFGMDDEEEKPKPKKKKR